MTRVRSVAVAPQRPNQRRIGNQYSAASASATTRTATGCFLRRDQSTVRAHRHPVTQGQSRRSLSVFTSASREIFPTGAGFPAAFAIGHTCNVVEALVRAAMSEARRLAFAM